MSERASLQLWRRKVVRRGLTYSLVLVVLIFGLGGVGFWALDPKVDNLLDGLWLSFTTAATVGYGDLVPSTTLSRAFAVLMVLLGLSVLSLVTASLAAIFVEKDVVEDERRVDAELLREVRRLRMEVETLSEQLKQASTSRPSDPLT